MLGAPSRRRSTGGGPEGDGRAGPKTRRPTVKERLWQFADRLSEWDGSIRSNRWFDLMVRSVSSPVTTDPQNGRFFLEPAILGTLATTLIIVGGCQPQSPFVQKQHDAWFFGISSANGSTLDVFFGLVCVYAGLILFVRVWVGLMRALAHTEKVPVAKLGWLLALWSIPLLIGPPLFSHDIYSYAAQGEMMSRHINPYQYGPYTLGQTPLTWLVDPLWYNTPSPYGPLFEEIAGGITNLCHHNVLAELVLLRLLSFAGVVLIAVSLPSLARSLGADPAKAFAFAVLNPVTIFHLIGGAHNDALMVGLLVAGLALAKKGHRAWGIVLCALAASVKAPAAVGIVYIGWDWLGDNKSIKERVRPVVTAVLMGATVIGLLSLVTGLGWGWVSDLASPDSVRSWMAPATAVGLGIWGVLHLVGLGLSQSRAISAVQFLGLFAAAVLAVRWLLKADKIGWLYALGLTMLWIVILGPVVQPWYFVWGLVLLSPVAKGWVRRVLIVLSIALVFICFSGGNQLTGDLRSSFLDVAVGLLILLAVFLVPLGRIEERVRPAVGSSQPR